MAKPLNTKITDAEAFEHYDSPAARKTTPAPPRRLRARPSQRLSEYVPVRLASQTLEEVRQRAADEGLTVSAWLRRLVERDIAAARQTQPTGPDALVRLLQDFRSWTGQLEALASLPVRNDEPRDIAELFPLQCSVVPSADGRWAAKREGARRASFVSHSHELAVKRAEDILLKGGGGVLVIFRSADQITTRLIPGASKPG